MAILARSCARTALFAFLLTPTSTLAIDRVVGTTGEFSNALAAALPGDTISLIPGVYDGGHFRSGLTDVTIRQQPDSVGAAVIQGGVNGIQLSDAVGVTFENLTFRRQTGNGINIDDGGSFATPSTDITIRNVRVLDMNATGNNDGIKLSGVTGFLIENVTVHNWGAGGSAIDPVGSHRGLIHNSAFTSTVATGGSAIRPKGGSKDITIRANYIQLPQGAGRGIQAGGSTGSQFFRFIDGDSGYEASEIVVEGNVIEGGSSAISWVNINGGIFHHNYIERPGDWAFRLLNENVGSPIVDTQNGVMADNIIVFEGDSWRRAGNYDGPGVLEQTFSFERNQWFNEDDPTVTGSTPQLPSAEIEGLYGIDPQFTLSEPALWEFEWGQWYVTSPFATTGINVDSPEGLLLATPGDDAEFDTLLADPLSGSWSFQPAPQSLPDDPSVQFIVIRPEACGLCSTIPGDYDRSGAVDAGDYELWRQQFGATGPALADGNGDGIVNTADYVLLRNALSNSTMAPIAAPEPMSAVSFAILAIAMLSDAARLRP